MTKNILISDANHGGLILLEEYSKYTKNNLFFYDTYNKLTSDEKDNLNRKYHVKFLSLKEIVKNRNKYTIISPLHMNPVFKSDYTHHQFTGYLINKHKLKHGWNFKIMEVTGVKGKTTTVTLIKEVLKNKNTLVLTSNALSYNSPDENMILSTSLSITPASILSALNMAAEMNLLEKIDYCIFEVSLGITANTDIGLLTNILEDYSIANNTQTASSAKKSVFSAEKVICDKKSYDEYYSDMNKNNLLTVSLNDSGADIYADNIEYNLEDTSFTVNYENKKYSMSCFAPTDFYINNILYAVCVGLSLGIDIKTIASNIKNTSSVKGRGSVKYIKDKTVFEDINPGLNTTSIEKCISNLKRYSSNYILIIGGDYGITCEEIDEKRLAGYISKINVPLILCGDVGISLSKQLKVNHISFNSIENAFDYCLDSDYDIIQIIYRSEYNRHVTYYCNK